MMLAAVALVAAVYLASLLCLAVGGKGHARGPALNTQPTLIDPPGLSHPGWTQPYPGPGHEVGGQVQQGGVPASPGWADSMTMERDPHHRLVAQPRVLSVQEALSAAYLTVQKKRYIARGTDVALKQLCNELKAAIAEQDGLLDVVRRGESEATGRESARLVATQAEIDQLYRLIKVFRPSLAESMYRLEVAAEELEQLGQ